VLSVFVRAKCGWPDLRKCPGTKGASDNGRLAEALLVKINSHAGNKSARRLAYLYGPLGQ